MLGAMPCRKCHVNQIKNFLENEHREAVRLKAYQA